MLDDASRALMWRAFPLGCLLRATHRTQGGFTCIGRLVGGPRHGWHFVRLDGARCIVDDDLESWTATRTRAIAEMVGESGDDLLPVVNRFDAPTWACLVAELAHLFERDPNVLYVFGAMPGGEPGDWRLGPQGGGTNTCFHFEIEDRPVVDRPLALVCAFIQAREGTSP